MKRFFFVIVIVIFLGALGWKIYEKLSASDQGGPPRREVPAIAVEIAPVEKKTIQDIGYFTGTLLPHSRFEVAPKISGRLEKLEVNIGDTVKNGQLIAQLEDDEYLQKIEEDKAALEVAKASLEESESSLGVTQREFERLKELLRKNAASESDFDKVETELKVKEARCKVAEARVVQEEAGLKSSQIRLSYTKIYVSWDEGEGQRVVGERYVDEGALLAANTPIVSVMDINPLKALIHVIERDYSEVKIGQEALITTDAFPGETFSGKIVRIAPLLKETSRQARVEVEIPNNQGKLKPGMFIRARIEFSEHTDATVVPVSSVIRHHDKQGVFRVDTENKKARFVPLAVGIKNDELAEILEPPLSGFVVTMGQHLLEDGASVILPRADEEKQPEKSENSQAQDSGTPPSP